MKDKTVKTVEYIDMIGDTPFSTNLNKKPSIPSK